MLLRLSRESLDCVGVSPDPGDRPVRPFPQTWNIAVVDPSTTRRIHVATEEYTLWTLLFCHDAGTGIAAFLNSFEDRLIQLQGIPPFPGLPPLNGYAITLRNDPRMISIQDQWVEEVRRQFALRGNPPPDALTLRDVERALAPKTRLLAEASAA